MTGELLADLEQWAHLTGKLADESSIVGAAVPRSSLAIRAERRGVLAGQLRAGILIVMYGNVHVTPRAALGFIPYKHFGVEMPAGGICENSPQGVRVVTFAEFGRSGRSWAQNSDAGPAGRAEAVRRATSAIGERRYSLSGNNCEHFANWCATGVAISHQVVAFMAALLRLAWATLAAGLTIAVARAALATE